MMQKEVAERICAKPGNKSYGSLTLLIQYFAEPKILFRVPKDSFSPVPKVDSAFVAFEVRRKSANFANVNLFKRLIKAAFQQRRKKVINAFVHAGIDQQDILKVFKKLNYNSNLRAENLDFQNYLDITNSLKMI